MLPRVIKLLAFALLGFYYLCVQAAPEPALSDLVVALASSSDRLAVAQGTRSYRRGIPTFITTSNQKEVDALNLVLGKYNETYAYFPDEATPTDPAAAASRRPGDLRAALTPFAAHQHYTSRSHGYKWMLYGDDDTLYFMPGVRQLLSKFDHRLPLALTDNVWHADGHPHLSALRCLPCGYNDSSLPTAQTSQPYTPQPACPHCTPKHACSLALSSQQPGSQPECTFAGLGAHGGAGIIFSAALLDQLTANGRVFDCLKRVKGCSGGDCLVSACLWEAGFWYTDPGHSLGHQHPLRHVLFDNAERRKLVKAPMDALVKGTCDDECKDLVRHAVSYHVRTSSYSSHAKAVGFMYTLVESHAAAVGFLGLLEEKTSKGEGGGAGMGAGQEVQEL